MTSVVRFLGFLNKLNGQYSLIDLIRLFTVIALLRAIYIRIQTSQISATMCFNIVTPPSLIEA